MKANQVVLSISAAVPRVAVSFRLMQVVVAPQHMIQIRREAILIVDAGHRPDLDDANEAAVLGRELVLGLAADSFFLLLVDLFFSLNKRLYSVRSQLHFGLAHSARRVHGEKGKVDYLNQVLDGQQNRTHREIVVL